MPVERGPHKIVSSIVSLSASPQAVDILFFLFLPGPQLPGGVRVLAYAVVADRRETQTGDSETGDSGQRHRIPR
jgi:hypothetical protein